MRSRHVVNVLLALVLVVASASATHRGREHGGPPRDGYGEGYQDGYEAGYADGYANGSAASYEQGYSDGYANGTADGYVAGYADGLAAGTASGYSDGYAAGSGDGYAQGYAAGYQSGHSDGHADGFLAGYSEGYEAGFEAGMAFSPPAGVPKWPHPVGACSPPYHVQGAGWDVCWQQDDLRVQGLEINRAFFHNQSVVWKMGFPFSLTRYEKVNLPPFLGIGPFKDTLGTPQAAGLEGFGRGKMAIGEDACPRFFQRGSLLNDGRICVEERDDVNPAIALWARYDVFNYRMIQGWILDSRGVMEPTIALGGQLIDGDTLGAQALNHFHHLYWRIDFDISSPGNDLFQAFKRIAGEVPASSSALRSVDELAKTLGLASCAAVKPTTGTFWCDVSRETTLRYEKATFDKWRVADKVQKNVHGSRKSFEFVVHSDSTADEFSRFDTMVLQHMGDSTEIGHEVVSTPFFGDDRVVAYSQSPTPAVVLDPVVWVAFHMYHDTRAEDGPSMTYHFAGFQVRPRDFLDGNPGEATYP